MGYFQGQHVYLPEGRSNVVERWDSECQATAEIDKVQAGGVEKTAPVVP